ncbi:VOC family protein [Spirillospora sp. NPDC029432]|uniref:VOC family protein n=1 Tax=Spirillospora sp. NPDC029432 TaxID=3154599 RepID=UPI0034546464
MLGVSGFGHVSVTVSDLDRSGRWYERVLGLERVAELDKPAFRKVIFEDRASGIVISLTHHGAKGSGDSATEFRTGLDHLAFVVPSFRELEAWRARLDEFEVRRTEILETSTGWVLVFRDPDNLQLEFYAARDAVSSDYRPTEGWKHNYPPVHPATGRLES